MEKELLAQALQMPTAYLFVDKLRAALDLEQARRKRFYEEVHENEKAEFINGEVIVHSPVMKRHNVATGLIFSLFNIYVNKNNLGFVGIEKIMLRLTRNDYEPDVCFFKKQRADAFSPTQMFFPAPDLAVEVISTSTEKIDREIKFEDYAAHGVQEYWIIDPDREIAEQYLLEGEKFVLNFKSKEGVIHCQAIAGLDFPVRAIFDPSENAKALALLF
ncbi:MAG: Uma2 family endonuclease [Runella sp.]